MNIPTFTVRLSPNMSDILRPGTPRDALALTWLAETSPWVHDLKGREGLRALLAAEPSLLWLHNGVLRGAVLISLYRQPVASVRLLALRDADDRFLFSERALPQIEAELARQRMRWLSLNACPAWLARELEASGYRIQDRVITYHKADLWSDLGGNREVNVRRARWEDVAPILELDAAAFAPFWHVNEGIVGQALDEPSYALVAEAEGEVAGYLLTEPWGQEAYISRLGVHPTRQRRGVATRLMREALALFRRSGFRGVWLNTQEDNLPSRSLYARLGFQPSGEADVYWAKPLNHSH